MVQNIPNLKEILGKIKEEAKPGVFAAHRARIETAFPEAAKTAKIAEQKATFKRNEAFGDPAQRALDQEIEDRDRGALYQKQGRRQFLGYDLIDDTGRSTVVDEFVSKIREMTWDAVVQPQQRPGTMDLVPFAGPTGGGGVSWDEVGEKIGEKVAQAVSNAFLGANPAKEPAIAGPGGEE